LNLALTSDFPSTGNQAILNCMRARSSRPRIAWIPPFSAAGRERFLVSQRLFESYGFTDLDFCDIDEEPNEEQLNHLDRYDVIYLSGGDPVGFRRNMLRTRLDEYLGEYLEAGGLIVAANGGSMQFTKNISLYRLLTMPLDEVVLSFCEYAALGIVKCEILPHLNRFESSFLERVGRYSERIPHDVLAIADGAALIHADGDRYRCVGQVIKYRDGVISSIETNAVDIP
jgi:peptidase E